MGKKNHKDGLLNGFHEYGEEMERKIEHGIKEGKEHCPCHHIDKGVKQMKSGKNLPPAFHKY
jgi:hypothetical protein